jgi:diacylglycerol O-acyltransferase
MKALTLADMGFLYTETVTSPKHVAGLQIFSLPANYHGHFTHDLFDNLMSHKDVKYPFNLKLKKQLTGLFHWQADRNIDLSYHVRFTTLPKPGIEDQLLAYIEQQHEKLLDRNRPLWQMTLIDGLEKNQFAVYIKFHHALADGMRSNQLLMSYLNHNQRSPLTAFWAIEHPEKKHEIESLLTSLSKTSKKISNQVKSIPSLTKLTTKLLLQAAHIYKAGMPTPFTAPKTPFSVSPTHERRLAKVSLPLTCLKRLSIITGATINDIAVTLCDMAIHNYLSSKNITLEKPLVAQIPISLRHKSDTTTNNRIGISMVELAYSGECALERLTTIKNACIQLKNETNLLTDEAFINYTLASQGLAVVSELLKLDTVLPPMSNVLISNLPGPRLPLYMMGAKMEQCIPLSALPPGISLNITFYSYRDTMNIGLVACRNALPDLTNLATYIEAAFVELESDVMKCAATLVSEKIAQFTLTREM